MYIYIFLFVFLLNKLFYFVYYTFLLKIYIIWIKKNLQILIWNINADNESSSLDSARSFRSKRTNLTYVIESRTDVSSRGKLDDELAEFLSRESDTTFRTCYIESKHFIDEEKTSASLKQPIEECSSNVETNGGRVECKTIRITKSCENGGCTFDFDRTGQDVRISHGSRRTRKQDNEKESVVREAFFDSVSVQS